MGKFILNGKTYTGNSADGFPPLIYSDDEREVGVWRDGKPLYQRVFKGQLTASALYDNICTKTDYNIDEIVNFDGYWGNKSVGYFAQLGCYIENGFFGGIYISGSTVQLYHPRNLDYYVVILRYTKTTDTPGSGYWATNGDRAIHYSTTEQVIGTWIDGKPLYEKTLYVQYSDLTAYGSFKGIPLQGTNEKIRNIVSACGISTSYGNCFLGCTLYGNLNDRSRYYALNMYYNILVIEVSGYSWEQIAPDICATIQYTKTTD